MKRPKQHVIDTEAQNNLYKILPSTWVTRLLGSDYGLDYMVEIFQNEISTGKIFYIQLKGTEQQIENGSIKYQLKKKHIDYFNSIQTPILFLIYSLQNSQFYGLWANDIKELLVGKNSNQYTYTIKFNHNQILNSDYFKELEQSFSDNLPKKININIDSNTENGKLFHTKLLEWLRDYYDNDITMGINTLPHTWTFVYRENNHTLSFFVTNIKERIQLSDIDLSNNQFLNLPFLDKNNCQQYFKEILILCSMLFYKVNIRNSIKLLSEHIGFFDKNLLTPRFLYDITISGIKSNCKKEIKELITILIECDKIDLFQHINMAILLCNDNNSLSPWYQQNLLQVIERVKNITDKGLFCYNLANSYRGSGNYYLASKYYQLARKKEPRYLNNYYWWFEYAGVLFLSDHFSLSEKFYRKSFELNNEQNLPLIYFLIADTLFFQGKFQEAYKAYDKYIALDKNNNRETIIKRIVCKFLIEKRLDSLSFNRIKSDDLVKQFLNDMNIEKLTNAIYSNPLNGCAWFNYALWLNNNNKSDESLLAFLTVVSIQDGDKEAWKNCLLTSFNQEQLELFIIIYKVFIQKFGKEGVNFISKHILIAEYIEESQRQSFINLLVELKTKIE